jgi:hypothetical protein
MNVGRKLKELYGVPSEVDRVYFKETQNHLIMMIKTYDLSITHKQVNAVLNRYPIGNEEHHWIFIESRLAIDDNYLFFWNNQVEGSEKEAYMLSVYRINKEVLKDLP